MKPIILYLFFILLIAGNGAYGQDEQRWEFTFVFGGQAVAGAIASCKAGGACTASSWVVLTQATFGWDFKLDFAVQFSGTAVRLMLFHKTLDSDCGNVMLTTATGTGYADAIYPAATTAEGNVTITYDAPAGEAGGSATWSARRLRNN